MFGDKLTRSGGKALQFYSFHVVWLANLGKIKVKRKGIERTVGINIKANPKKSKGGPPFREVEFPIYFNFGVDDVRAGLDWLNQVGRLDAIGLGGKVEKGDDEEDEKTKGRQIGKKKGPKATKALQQVLNRLDTMPDDEYRAFRKRLNKAVKVVWRDVEEIFEPRRRKYA
jgi:RecA/RadA recombinase